MNATIHDKIAGAVCVCSHQRLNHASYDGDQFAGIGTRECARRGCRCREFRDVRKGKMLGAELTEGVIFKQGEGAIKRWLKINTIGPVSHLKAGNVRRLTAYDRDGNLHRVKVDADKDYQVSDEFPRRKEKKGNGVAAEFSHEDNNNGEMVNSGPAED
jgi:hypothetical protein